MKAIITALNAAYSECGYVQKAGKNKEQGYRFAGEADFIEAVRPVLLKHGIVVYPSGYELVVAENYATKSGTRMNRIVARYTFTFAHTSGESIEVTAIGEGADTSDKCSPKAATIALKYALRQTLLIETGDDPDAVTPEPRAGADKPQPPTAEQKEAKAKQFLDALSNWLEQHPHEEHAAHVMANIDAIKACMKYESLKGRAADYLALVDETQGKYRM